MPSRIARSLRRFTYGPGVFKVDYAIEGDIDWLNDECRRAGTLHLGGSASETFANEHQVAVGRVEAVRHAHEQAQQRKAAAPAKATGSAAAACPASSACTISPSPTGAARPAPSTRSGPMRTSHTGGPGTRPRP